MNREIGAQVNHIVHFILLEIICLFIVCLIIHSVNLNISLPKFPFIVNQVNFVLFFKTAFV